MQTHSKPTDSAVFLQYATSLGLWSLFALVIAGYYTAAKAPMSVRFGFGVFFLQLVVVLLPFALLSPSAFNLCKKLYRQSRSRLAWMAKNIALCGLWYLVANALSTPFEWYFWYGEGTSYWDVYANRNINQVLSSVASYWIVAAWAMVVGSFEERQNQELTFSRLQAQLSETKLQNLRYQLNPHFLFNSINAAISFVRTGQNPKAERMLLALADLMDAYLSSQTPLTMRLDEELALLKKYLEIETIRFGAKLRFELEVDDPCLAAQVPSMLLQPLVENAVRHGISRITGTGLVRLQAATCGADLKIDLYNDVEDSATPAHAAKQGHGLGQSLTLRRLKEAYGHQASMVVGPGVDGGYRVCLRFPAGFQKAIA